MRSAKEVADLIQKLKSDGLPLQDVAWQSALACEGWAYVFGARGEYCDPSNRRSRASDAHPTIKNACKNFNGRDSVPAGCVGCKWFLGNAKSDQTKHEGRTRFFDCRGFTYWILKQVYGFTLTGAGATTQWNTASNWKSKGQIADMPKDMLCCLFVQKGKTMEHTGFGFKNETVECSLGVQHFTKRNKKWTHWAVPACIDDSPSPEPGRKPTLKRGDKGEYVTLCQSMLVNRGYNLGKYGVDGDFGQDTENAVKAFQTDYGLLADGIVGDSTWDALESTPATKKYTVHIPGLPQAQAQAIVSKYHGAYMTVEGGE